MSILFSAPKEHTSVHVSVRVKGAARSNAVREDRPVAEQGDGTSFQRRGEDLVIVFPNDADIVLEGYYTDNAFPPLFFMRDDITAL